MQIHADSKGITSSRHHTVGQPLYELLRKYHFTLSFDVSGGECDTRHIPAQFLIRRQ